LEFRFGLQIWTSDLNHLAGIHPVVRVERLLDRPHDAQGGAMLLLEKLHLANADAVLPAAGPTHRERAKHHSLVEPPRLLELVIVRGVEHVNQMEVSIARVADETDRKGRVRVLALCLDTQSARREIGTQTSVVQARDPGLRASAAYSAS